MARKGRGADELRQIGIQRGFVPNAMGSALIQGGDTMVLCTVCVEDGVPNFLLNTNQGWLTAEYSMLPASTQNRKARDGRRGGTDARSLEIGRLIGRSLRACCNLGKLPGRTVWVDCDVLQADGGTRTLSISGAMVALTDAFRRAEQRGLIKSSPITSPVAAISAGLVRGEALLDLDYQEDSRADVDMNVVMNANGEFIELQSSAERTALSPDQLSTLLGYCDSGIQKILELQSEALRNSDR